MRKMTCNGLKKVILYICKKLNYMAETKIKSQKEYPNALPIGTILKGGTYSYTIEEVLGQGSYGITYKVSTKTDMGNIPVKLVFAVKENFTQNASLLQKKEVQRQILYLVGVLMFVGVC